ncbi:MAG: hypothetical protein IT385_05920 [Deltaproteobacteria bacterium]|nr:hypothetical protein [Deltaproteobacteria bacterium]
MPPPAHAAKLGPDSGHVHRAHSHAQAYTGPNRFVRKKEEKAAYSKEQAKLFGETIEKLDPRGIPYELEQPGEKGDWSTLGIVVMAVCVVIAFAVTLFIALDDDANTRMSMFFKGSSCGESGTESCLMLYVTQDKRRKEEMWRQEDLRAKPIYGTVELRYTPQRARVDIGQLKFVKAGSAAARNEAGVGDPVCTTDSAGQRQCETMIANDTHNLPEGKHVETLRIADLPLYETERDEQGSIAKVFTYFYHLKISHEGYEPREFLWRPQDWQPALGNYTIAGAGGQSGPIGVDLIAKPETLKPNFIQAHKDIKCNMEKGKLASVELIPEKELDGIYTSNGFKNRDDWKRVEEVLTGPDHVAWWTEATKEITEHKCPTDTK